MSERDAFTCPKCGWTGGSWKAVGPDVAALQCACGYGIGTVGRVKEPPPVVTGWADQQCPVCGFRGTGEVGAGSWQHGSACMQCGSSDAGLGVGHYVCPVCARAGVSRWTRAAFATVDFLLCECGYQVASRSRG